MFGFSSYWLISIYVSPVLKGLNNLKKINKFIRYIKFLEDYGVIFTPFQVCFNEFDNNLILYFLKFRLYLTNLDRNPSQFSHFLHKSIDRISLGPRKSQILVRNFVKKYLIKFFRQYGLLWAQCYRWCASFLHQFI